MREKKQAYVMVGVTRASSVADAALVQAQALNRADGLAQRFRNGLDTCGNG